MPSYVHLIMIIVMLHVFGSHFGSHIGFANIVCKLYIYNGVMSVFMFAAAILAAMLNISINPRVPQWHQPDYE